MRWSNRNKHNISSIKKFECLGRARAIALNKGNNNFIKDNVPRDDDSVRGEIKVAVSFMISGVSQKDT